MAELEAQAAAEPVQAAEKEATSQSVEQLEARVQTKDQVSQGQGQGSWSALPGTQGPLSTPGAPSPLGDPDFEESEHWPTRGS